MKSYAALIFIVLAMGVGTLIGHDIGDQELKIIEKTIIQTNYTPRKILYREEVNEAIRDRIAHGKIDVVLAISTDICPDPIIAYLITTFALIYDIPTPLLFAIVSVESSFNPEAVSRAGAVGLMQLLPSTFPKYTVEELKDPKLNLRLGCEYLLKLKKRYKTWEEALVFYNGKPVVSTKNRFGGMYYMIDIVAVEREYERIFNEQL